MLYKSFSLPIFVILCSWNMVLLPIHHFVFHLPRSKWELFLQPIHKPWRMPKRMGHYKIDSWNFSTFFWFPSKMVSYGSLLAMVTTVFDKTQVWPRKSILSVKSYPDLSENHLKLIRDNLKIFFGDENLALKPGGL